MGPKAAARGGLALAVKAVAAGADVVRPAAPGLVVLIYHRIGGRTGTQIDLPTEAFAAQVAALVDEDRLVSLDEGLRLLDADDLDRRPVVMTFDDGTEDWADEALPVLVEHGAPATFYVATGFVEEGRSFPSGGRPISWAGLGELVASGLATIGSHTHTHALLDRVDAAAAADELSRSVDLIGERLGVTCEHFAYPKALLGSAAAEAEVRHRFRSAVVAGSRANPAASDVHRLHRTPIQVADGMRWFRHKADGGMWLEDAARQVLNRGRYAGAAT